MTNKCIEGIGDASSAKGDFSEKAVFISPQKTRYTAPKYGGMSGRTITDNSFAHSATT